MMRERVENMTADAITQVLREQSACQHIPFQRAVEDEQNGEGSVTFCRGAKRQRLAHHPAIQQEQSEGQRRGNFFAEERADEGEEREGVPTRVRASNS